MRGRGLPAARSSFPGPAPAGPGWPVDNRVVRVRYAGYLAHPEAEIHGRYRGQPIVAAMPAP